MDAQTEEGVHDISLLPSSCLLLLLPSPNFHFVVLLSLDTLVAVVRSGCLQPLRFKWTRLCKSFVPVEYT